ncbi:hypothetical protein ABEB36_012472 [Hypothenemus hampei]|uniref:Uncharacterized protein n=1 Tax=Hypothenemus hampei TaxID=57062 RepID=A0ABD1EBD2_HYPHA
MTLTMTGASRIFNISFKNFNFLIISFCIGLNSAVPHHHRSKNRGNKDAPHLVYDQKQTGDYNIQLHLKDFQIIALLGDETLSDYDYNYDYADFTVKPQSGSSSSSSTTSKPIESSSTLRPEMLIYSNSSGVSITTSTLSPSTNTSPNSLINSTILNNIHPLEIFIQESQFSNSSKNSSKQTSSTLASIENMNLNESTTNSENITIPFSSSTETNTLGKIKVQILDGYERTTPALPQLDHMIVPGEDHGPIDLGDEILQGEIASYRKCSNGFARDKKGKCRRVRRPTGSYQLPFGFGRLASNLATRLRLPMPGLQSDQIENTH